MNRSKHVRITRRKTHVDEISESVDVGEGYISQEFNNSESMSDPYSPPYSPPPQGEKSLYPDGPRPCLYEYPNTREWIRRRLHELEVTNSNQLIRTRTAAELLEAIGDFERALESGFKVKMPTAYFRRLLE